MGDQGNRYLQIVTPGVSELHDGPIPGAGPGQALVRIEAITTCPHWDLHLASGEPMFPGLPLQYPYPPGQPGHEAVGRVEAVGEGVDGLGPGMRVAAWRDPGHQRPGCYARYNVFDADHLLPVPEGLPATALAPLELAMCVQVSIDQLQRGYGLGDRRVAVGGLGPAGLIAVQLARAHGAGEVIGVDPIAERRELAAGLGAASTLAPEENPSTPFDLAIDCTGLKVSIEALMDRTTAAVAIFGVLREEVGVPGTPPQAGAAGISRSLQERRRTRPGPREERRPAPAAAGHHQPAAESLCGRSRAVAPQARRQGVLPALGGVTRTRRRAG